jgi:hypothetical protein
MMKRVSDMLPSSHNVAPSYGDRVLDQETLELAPTAIQVATSASEVVPGTMSNADYGMLGISEAHMHESDGTSQPTGNEPSGLPQVMTSTTSTQKNTALNNDSTVFSNFMHGRQDLNQSGDPGNLDILDPFSGFDIPFWFEQDQYWDIFQDVE